eukprot:scaffold246_cov414-Prasinococcus_capsulatus_cf.AAC.26
MVTSGYRLGTVSSPFSSPRGASPLVSHRKADRNDSQGGRGWGCQHLLPDTGARPPSAALQRHRLPRVSFVDDDGGWGRGGVSHAGRISLRNGAARPGEGVREHPGPLPRATTTTPAPAARC